jgi:DnaJ-class molecular chaperone
VVDVTVPPGVRDGQRLRLAGLGAPGERGASPGDLYVKIRVGEHPIWKRDGNDLAVEVPVTVAEAVLGASIRLATPFGEVQVKVPRATPSGRRLRLRGLGVPHRGGRGDLYARVLVRLPAEASSELDELARKLDRLYTEDVRKGLEVSPEAPAGAR